MKQKIVLAYSGGLDTSVILHWLKTKYKCDIIACIVDVGQQENFELIKQRALKVGAKKVYVIDAKEEFVKDYIFKVLKANAVYEGKYLLGTSIARPLIAKKVVEVAKKENAKILAHGATGKGNDQVRFELAFKCLYPEAKIIAPWRIWEIKSREEEINYAKKYKIPVPVTKEKPYSSDANLWHISYEGGILENLKNEPNENMFQLTVSPILAPNKVELIEINFKEGIPIEIITEEGKYNLKKHGGTKIIQILNKIGGRNGVGRSDIVENRLVGIKSRGVYEAPAATILYFAHRELEYLTLDKETFHYKEHISLEYAKLVYNGEWFTPKREALDKFIDATQKYVTGKIKLKLYKGNIVVVSRESKYSLYNLELASFDKTSKDILKYDQKDAEGFINLFGLQYKISSIVKKK
ncbi:MAG: argininosuccinate synthase [Elusimicrobiota bacterium]|nr:argininosuccinate synthase [Endomicrobiia bacterium]MDW8165656.1 argininosuccinate synthase [Elusimicrobiota bacterium]